MLLRSRACALLQRLNQREARAPVATVTSKGEVSAVHERNWVAGVRVANDGRALPAAQRSRGAVGKAQRRLPRRDVRLQWCRFHGPRRVAPRRQRIRTQPTVRTSCFVHARLRGGAALVVSQHVCIALRVEPQMWVLVAGAQVGIDAMAGVSAPSPPPKEGRLEL